jgi:hypothetical protein
MVESLGMRREAERRDNLDNAFLGKRRGKTR